MIVLSFLYVISYFASVIAVGCPNGWTQYDNSCYVVSTTKMSFLAAATHCQDQGGFLSEIETSSENTHLKEFLADYENEGFWIGGNDIHIEGLFVWDRSEIPFNYTDWHHGEPNSLHGDEDCVGVWKQWSYQWADVACSHAGLGAVCETTVVGCS